MIEDSEFVPENLYHPEMSEDEVQIRRDWQDRIYQEMFESRGDRVVSVLDKELTVLEGVFPPTAPDSILLAETVQREVDGDDSVLDLGTGTGIQGIIAAEKGARVVATDISSQLLKCARLNFEKQGLAEKVEVLESDLFSGLEGRKFDWIVFNSPFRWFKPRDEAERACLDENYQTLTRFFKEAKDYLENNGRILMVFSDSGDINYFESLIEDNNYQSEVVKERTVKYDDQCEWKYKVYKLCV